MSHLLCFLSYLLIWFVSCSSVEIISMRLWTCGKRNSNQSLNGVQARHLLWWMGMGEGMLRFSSFMWFFCFCFALLPYYFWDIVNSVCACVCVCMHPYYIVCVCVCVHQRERERVCLQLLTFLTLFPYCRSRSINFSTYITNGWLYCVQRSDLPWLCHGQCTKVRGGDLSQHGGAE